jgi:hypothetical protein
MTRVWSKVFDLIGQEFRQRQEPFRGWDFLAIFDLIVQVMKYHGEQIDCDVPWEMLRKRYGFSDEAAHDVLTAYHAAECAVVISGDYWSPGIGERLSR